MTAGNQLQIIDLEQHSANDQRTARTYAAIGLSELQGPQWEAAANCAGVQQLLGANVLAPGTTLEQLQADIADQMSLDWTQLFAEEAQIAKLPSDVQGQSRRLLVMPAAVSGPDIPAATASKSLKRTKPQEPSPVKSPRSAAPTASSSARVLAPRGSVRQARNEADVQAGFNLFLRKLKNHLPDLQWNAWNTSSSGVNGSRGKVDLTFTQSSLVAWAQVLFLAELKPKLDGSGYQEAVGQIIDCAAHVFTSQPDRRRLLAFVASSDQLEVMVVARGHGVWLRSERLEFSWTAQSEGLRLLLRLLVAPIDVHKYHPTILQGFATSAGKLTELTLLDVRPAPESAASSRSASHSASQRRPRWCEKRSRTVRLFRAKLLTTAGSEELVAVKFGKCECVEAEVSAAYIHKKGHTLTRWRDCWW